MVSVEKLTISYIEEPAVASTDKPSFHHHEAPIETLAAAEIAQEVQKVDEDEARELKQEWRDSDQGGYVPRTAEEKAQNRALNRKFDLYIVPFCAIIYLFNGLDRSNLGNVQTHGFTKDLGMPVSAINTATSLFLATYVPLQPLSAAIGKRVEQTYWLGFIAIGWVVLTLEHAFIKTETQLIAVRLLIGICEASFYPTVVSYLSLFYPRDLAFRIAIIYGSYAIAGAFGGLIAYGAFHIPGNLHDWQYLFIIEGCCTLLIAIITPFWLARAPSDSWFLNETEKAFASNRMILDPPANLDSRYKLSRRDIRAACLDWKLWAVLPFNILASIAAQGFSIFFPIVVKGLGYSGPTANLMTVPPYVVGTIFLLCFAYASDHYHKRAFFILPALLIIMIGLIMTITIPLHNTGGRYAGLLVLLAGTFISGPIEVSWLAGNTPKPGKRTMVLAINGWGNLAGIIGSELFQPKYGPDYQFPLKVTLGLVGVSFVGYVAYCFELRFANKYKAKKVAAMTPEELEHENFSDKRYADRKWTFVYGL